MTSRGNRRQRPRVVVVTELMTEYRVAFYEPLRRLLDEQGIDLEVVYGSAAREDPRGHAMELDWGRVMHTKVLHLFGRELSYQPIVKLALDADLVVVEQASKRVANYVLLALQRVTRMKVALWGHGRNFQRSTASAAGEAVKAWVSRLPHWWFAYNDLSAAVVRDLGFPAERITSVQNAIDTRSLTAALERLHPQTVSAVRSELGLRSENVAIYCGGLIALKRLDFLIAAAEAVREEIGDFELIIVGDGPERGMVLEAAERHAWIHWVGARFGDDRVPYFAVSRAFMLPGMVGLAVLDGFALEVPLVASSSAEHSPEIDYLDHEVNGLLADDKGSPRVYADAVVAVLTDGPLHERLRAGCRESREQYTAEHMAERFAAGVVAALAAGEQADTGGTRQEEIDDSDEGHGAYGQRPRRTKPAGADA